MELLIEYSEHQQCFHYNSRKKDGRWEFELYSNGWVPICSITDDVLRSNKFNKLMTSLTMKGCSASHVKNSILTFLKR